MQKLTSLFIFLILVVGGGLVIGYLTAPGSWYTALSKPSFNPPGWVFGPVWTALYIAIAIAGWLVWRNKPLGWAMALWSTQLVLNFLWSPIFFSAHLIDVALVIIVMMLAAILGFIWIAWRRARVAAILFVPYAVWVAFATLLNGTIAALN